MYDCRLARAIAVGVYAAGMALVVSALAAQRTSAVVIAPWSSGKLAGNLVVSRRVGGSCGMHSLESERPDAWRCRAGDDMYDPCFADPHRATRLACMEGPFSRRVTLMWAAKSPADGMKLTGELWGLRLRDAPWGMRLANGDTCVFVTGATDAYDGDRLNYACARSGWILGVPDRSTPVWTARSINYPKHRVTRVAVAAAVF